MSTIITDREELREVIAYIKKRGAFAFDTETRGADENGGDVRLDWRRNEVFWLSLATYGESWAVPIAHPIGKATGTTKEPRVDINGKTRMFTVPTWSDPPKQLGSSVVFGEMESLFFSNVLKVGHNLKFDLQAVQKYYDGEIIPPNYFCTLVAAQVLDQKTRDYKLGSLTKQEYHFVYDKSLGKRVEEHPYLAAAKYAELDAKWTWMLYRRYRESFEAKGLEGIWAMEMDILEVLLHMEREGVCLDVQGAHTLHSELERKLEQLQGEMYRIAGRSLNINSGKQLGELLFGLKKDGNFGLKCTKRTKSGQPSTDKASLEELQHPFLDVYRESALATTVQSAVTTWIGGEVKGHPDAQGRVKVEYKPTKVIEGRLNADFRQTGTRTGRMSCVSGDTLLTTTRGTFRFDEYLPVPGDMVLTHRGRLRKVLRKIRKGTDEMVAVSLGTGEVLKCTREHRVLTPTGWRFVGSLKAGDEVLHHVSEQRVHEQPRERSAGAEHLLRGGQADGPRGIGQVGRELPERTSGCCESPSREVQERESAALLTVQDRDEEPNVWQEWIVAPQLQGGHQRRSRIPAEEGGQPVRVRASSSDGGSAGDGAGYSPEDLGYPPHRQRQTQQLLGQPCIGNEYSAREIARFDEGLGTTQIRAIDAVGTMAVWDIEVEDDHSYLAGGLFNHNCSAPNLQNVSRPGDADSLPTRVRGLFIAPPGHKLLVADYGQIEYVVMAELSRDPMLVRAFNEGIDLHQYVASMVFNVPMEEVTKKQRGTAKNTNFAIAYGAGIAKIAAMSHISVPEAERFSKDHRRLLPTLYRWKDREIIKCKRTGPIPYSMTLMGRRRQIPYINSRNPELAAEGARQAVNAVVQGSAADLLKVAMIRLHRRQPDDMHLQLQIHDELVMSCPDDRVDDGQEILREAMLGPGIQKLLTVPLKIDMAVVSRWADAK